MKLPIKEPQIATEETVELLNAAAPEYPEPMRVALTSDEWRQTDLGRLINDTSLHGDAQVENDVIKSIKVSYDRKGDGFCGSLLYDGIVIWECNHEHSKPEYNRRDNFAEDVTWVAGAVMCARKARNEFIDNLYRRSSGARNYGAEWYWHDVGGFLGRHALAHNMTGGNRQDFIQIEINEGGLETYESYELRIWNGEPRVLYVMSKYGHRFEGAVIGYINLDDPEDTSGRPDPSLFKSSRHYRHWLRVAAWGYTNVWGDSFRRSAYATSYGTQMSRDYDKLDPKIPARAAEYFRADTSQRGKKKKDEAPTLSMQKQDHDLNEQEGHWLRTNRAGRSRSYTIMHGDEEVEGDFLNRGEAIQRLEQYEKENAA